jgi:phosphatidylserine decarboxylase
MGVRPEVIPFVVASIVLGIVLGIICRVCGVKIAPSAIAGGIVALVMTCYMLYFFRDPTRNPPTDESLIVSGADGVIARISEVQEKEFLKTDCVRISIFLSLFSVHVNRAPITGRVKFLGYYPGKRYFTFQEKSSEFNQHSSILIEGKGTKCLVNQIVGPVARRVVYWLSLDQDLNKGDSIGMMKFGSRLDMYFPKSDVSVVIKEGDHVAAGETVIAKLRKGAGQ